MNHCAFVATVAFSGAFAMPAALAQGYPKTGLSVACSTAPPLPQIAATGFGEALAFGLTAMSAQPLPAGPSA